MSTPVDDPTLACGVTIPVDATAAQRASCTFGSGSHASESLGIDGAILGRIPIRHVIVMMKENRSFDHLLGELHDRGQPGVDAVPATYFNPDTRGRPVYPMHAATTCIPFDPSHQYASVLACIDGGKMDGFVRNAAETTSSDGTFAMSFYDETDLPFYYWLAKTFAIGDRDFPPMVGGTYGNRDYLLFGTNAGVVETGSAFPSPRTPSILRYLIDAGLTWGAYTQGLPFSGALDWTSSDPGVHPLDALFDDLDQGRLPNVSFVDGRDNIDDDHPPADLQLGEAWVKALYDHAIASPQWPRLAMFWTYDEAGAFADHVPPPRACPASASKSAFTLRGPRVPLVVISPWAKRNYVSHLARDHTAITRFIETLFDLPALSARDANSDALLDMFDFSCGRDLSLPPAPAAGSNGCLLHGGRPTALGGASP
jgi:phospholipase C